MSTEYGAFIYESNKSIFTIKKMTDSNDCMETMFRPKVSVSDYCGIYRLDDDSQFRRFGNM